MNSKRKECQTSGTISTNFITDCRRKIFEVIAKRIIRFVLTNKFITTSIQKAGIPGFLGCIEHALLLRDQIKAARHNKSAKLHVIWLDLENAYGSVRHPLIEKATDFFWIPEDIRKLLSGYYKCTYMKFSNPKYSTNWQKLNIGIMMRCVISSLIFVLVMEMLLRSTEDTTSKKTVPSMKAFMDDMTDFRVLIRHGKTAEMPTGAFQVSRNEDEAF